MAASTTTTKSVSYRRNRDYKKQFNWTYELNKDLFDYYIKANENPSKRLHEKDEESLGYSTP